MEYYSWVHTFIWICHINSFKYLDAVLRNMLWYITFTHKVNHSTWLHHFDIAYETLKIHQWPYKLQLHVQMVYIQLFNTNAQKR